MKKKNTFLQARVYMSSTRLVCAMALTLLSLELAQGAIAAESQSSVVRDPQAVTLLSEVLSGAGGMNAISGIRDVTATGTITYSGEASQEQAPVTVKLLGLHQFRLEAARGDGMHVTITGKKKSIHRNPDGSSSPLPVQNMIKPASTIFPFFYVLAAVQDASFEVKYLGLVSHHGQQVHNILVQQTFAQDKDPMGWLRKVATVHIFVDPNTMLIQAVADKAYRRDGEPGESLHETRFSNYTIANGILVPLSVTDSIARQPGLTMQFSQVSFNNGLTDADFE
jgi:hypothetical protein